MCGSGSRNVAGNLQNVNVFLYCETLTSVIIVQHVAARGVVFWHSGKGRRPTSIALHKLNSATIFFYANPMGLPV